MTASTEATLQGLWLHQGTGRLLTMSADGSYSVDDGGTIDTYPDDTGTFTILSRGRVRLTSGLDWNTCPAGSQVTWAGVRVTVPRLTITGSTDACTLRPRLAGRWVRLS